MKMEDLRFAPSHALPLISPNFSNWEQAGQREIRGATSHDPWLAHHDSFGTDPWLTNHHHIAPIQYPVRRACYKIGTPIAMGFGMKTDRPKPPLTLPKQEREILTKAARRRSAGSQDVIRAKVILLCADGIANREVARRTDRSEHKVETWRKRFLETRMAGLIDLPRSGRPRSIRDEKVAEIIRMHWKQNRTKPPIGAHAPWPVPQASFAKRTARIVPPIGAHHA